MKPDDSVTALVVVRPATPGSFHAGVPIDRSNLASVSPSADDVERVAGTMRSLGFEVGPMVGISMSITAPKPDFESALHVTLVERDGAWAADENRIADDAAGADQERLVPLDALPPGVADCIECITFEPPRDLHDEASWSV